MRCRKLYLFGALVVGLCLSCATTSNQDSHSSTQAAGNEQTACGMAGHHDHHCKDHHGKFAIDPSVPASFAEAPAVGTKFTCPVSGGVFEVDLDTRMSVYEGRHYALCCDRCAQDFSADPAYFVNRLEESLSDQ